MKPLTACLVVALLLGGVAQAEEEQETTQLYIGIEKRRIPYTYIDDTQRANGILINAITPLCEAINAKCEFVDGKFDNLLQDLQAYNLHGLLIIDAVVLPEIDRIKLTSPLCKLKPVFIQKQSNDRREKQEDFAKTTIGVLENSLFHLYLLDEYSHLARIKTYPLLESGVFDLVMDRIDVVFADEAFFNERVLNTPLGRGDNNDAKLIALQIETPGFFTTGMTLAINEQNSELIGALEKNSQAGEEIPACSDAADGAEEN